MQEAYCLLCSEYSFCCPNWVPPILTWLGGLPYLGTPQQGTPWQGTPPGRVLPWQGTPGGTWQGTPLAGHGRVPPSGVCPMAFWEMLQSIMGYGSPPPGVCPMAFWVMLQSIMGYGYSPLGVDKLTKWNYYLPVILRTRAVTIVIVSSDSLPMTLLSSDYLVDWLHCMSKFMQISTTFYNIYHNSLFS